jgi:hypothetical protein
MTIIWKFFSKVIQLYDTLYLQKGTKNHKRRHGEKRGSHKRNCVVKEEEVENRKIIPLNQFM